MPHLWAMLKPCTSGPACRGEVVVVDSVDFPAVDLAEVAPVLRVAARPAGAGRVDLVVLEVEEPFTR